MINDLLKDLPSGENPPQEINVVVEIPKGSRNKYEYHEKGYFTLDRALYSPVFFPFEYGAIPQTKSEDGDCLDVMLLTTFSTFPGCVIKAIPIGILLMKDENGDDNKVIAVPKPDVDPRFSHITTIEDLPDHFKKETQAFFEDYKKLELGKYVKIKGWGGKEEAEELIKRAIERYK